MSRFNYPVMCVPGGAALCLWLAGCAGVRTPPPEAAATESDVAAAVAEAERAPGAVTAATIAAAGDDQTKLVAQLNEASRELAALRVANARLSAENPRPPARSVAPAPQPGLVEEKVAKGLKSFGTLKQELATIVAETERLRAENADLNSRVKEANARADAAQAALARVEIELQTERRSREEADQAALLLHDQLRVVAQAVSSAVTVPARPEAGSGPETATLKYVVRPGDTLESIARSQYGDASRWRRILDANRGRLPLDGSLEVGAVIEIPRR